MRTVLVTNIPAPYRQTLYGELGRRIDDFTVLYEAGDSGARGWGKTISGDYEYAIATDRPIESISQVRRARATRAALGRMRPDLLIVTGFGAAALAAREWCAERRVPFVGLSGATAFADRDVTGPRRALRERLVRSAAGWIAYGPEAKRYLVELGADDDRVLAAGNPYGIDPAGGAPREPGAGARRIGFAGQLHWRKAWWVPVKAAAIAAGRGADGLSVSMIGSGPGGDLLRRLIAGTASVQVDWTPKLAPEHVHEFYDGIDVLVVPSLSDQWPIVASEAAARGVPVICTPEAVSGLPDELASAGPRARPGSVHAVARTLVELSGRDAYAAALGRVEAARAAADPVRVADRWAAHLERLAAT